jgi:hypothetical protein
MKILLITSLYPSYSGESRRKVTYALHNFAKHWNLNNDVLVIKPDFYPIPSNIYCKYSKNTIDQIKVINLPLFKIPKTNIFNKKSMIKLLKEEDFKPDIIISHSINSFIRFSYLAEYFDCKYIIGVHKCDLKWLEKRKDVVYNTLNLNYS